MWPRHRLVMPTSRQPANIPTQRYGAVGSPVVHDGEEVTRVMCIVRIIVKRKTITIREDQDEWIEDRHLNLSSFIREQLDELIEERE